MESSNAAVEILLVDDRLEDLRVLEAVLESPLYRIVTASSGEDALRKVLHGEFAVILLDVLLPGIDGFEIASIIKQRERSRHTPIIFLTASGAEMSAIYRAYSVGAVDYIPKPFDAAVVRAKVEVFAEMYRKDRRIQEQARALLEAEREASLARYQNLAEAIPDIVWTADPTGALLYCNRRWTDGTGLPVQSARGSGWIEALHPDDRLRCEECWRQAIARGEKFELEMRLRGPDGSHRYYLCRAMPERNDRGSLVGWLGTYSDFDDRKRAHEEAENAVRARDEFLSAASHELRTPLTSLNMQLQTLLRKLGDQDVYAAIRPKVESSERQARRLTRLIDALLDVSRISSDRLDLQLEALDVSALVEEVVQRQRDDLARAGCTVSMNANGALTGYWDRLRVDQVVTNLLTNAAKYGSGKPVEVRVEGDDRLARIRVADHGVGIAPEDQARIFDQFERSSAHREYGGVGLGLWIARKIVEAMGGAIRVQSTPGEGATFTVELPRVTSIATGAISA